MVNQLVLILKLYPGIHLEESAKHTKSPSQDKQSLGQDLNHITPKSTASANPIHDASLSVKPVIHRCPQPTKEYYNRCNHKDIQN
jgi:hypothetical protein